MNREAINICKNSSQLDLSVTRAQMLRSLVMSEHLRKLNRMTQQRVKWNRDLRELAVDGKIALVSGGRDCDGVCWEGAVTIVDATAAAVNAHIDHAYEWADGPIHFSLASPEDEVEYYSRDLGAEAYEDGHNHVIYA